MKTSHISLIKSKYQCSFSNSSGFAAAVSNPSIKAKKNLVKQRRRDLFNSSGKIRKSFDMASYSSYFSSTQGLSNFKISKKHGLAIASDHKYKAAICISPQLK